MSEQDIIAYAEMMEHGLALSEYRMLLEKASKSQSILVGKRQVDATYILQRLSKKVDNKGDVTQSD